MCKRLYRRIAKLGTSEGLNRFHHEAYERRNGVGIILEEQIYKNELKEKRAPEKNFIIGIEVEGEMVDIVDAYDPQFSCKLEEKNF